MTLTSQEQDVVSRLRRATTHKEARVLAIIDRLLAESPSAKLVEAAKMAADWTDDEISEAQFIAKYHVDTKLGGQVSTLVALRSALASVAQPPSCWHDGEPPKPFRSEWFIAVTTDGERAVLKSLPENYSYQYTTQDGTYMMAKKIKKWMQFPDSEFIPFVPVAQPAAGEAPSDSDKFEIGVMSAITGRQDGETLTDAVMRVCGELEKLRSISHAPSPIQDTCKSGVRFDDIDPAEQAAIDATIASMPPAPSPTQGTPKHDWQHDDIENRWECRRCHMNVHELTPKLCSNLCKDSFSKEPDNDNNTLDPNPLPSAQPWDKDLDRKFTEAFGQPAQPLTKQDVRRIVLETLIKAVEHGESTIYRAARAMLAEVQKESK